MPTDTTARPALTDLAEDETLFRDAIRDFAEGEIRPLAQSMEKAGRYDPDLIPKLFEMGLMGIEIPEELGGAGGSFFQSILAVEEVSRVDAAVGVMVDVQNTLFNNAVLRWANDEQKKRFLPRVAADTVGAYALSEAGSGSDAFALSCRAVPRGDGWVLNGQKLWITSAAEAGLFLLFATVDPAKGYKGITAFVVDREDSGFTVGKREDKLGIKASSTCELILEDCFLPADRVVGEVGKGYKIAIETLNEGRIGIGAQMVGLAQGAFDLALKYSQERQQFGRPIAEFQAVQFELAELATQIEAARLLTYNAARLRDVKLPFVKEAAMAKLFASRTAERVASSAIEVHGGYGFTREYPVEKYFRDQKVGQIYEGTTNMQLTVIAKQLLGKMH
jgi:alkylation response protein AidB-like acyl-CoA dehydrogenase